MNKQYSSWTPLVVSCDAVSSDQFGGGDAISRGPENFLAGREKFKTKARFCSMEKIVVKVHSLTSQKNFGGTIQFSPNFMDYPNHDFVALHRDAILNLKDISPFLSIAST